MGFHANDETVVANHLISPAKVMLVRVLRRCEKYVGVVEAIKNSSNAGHRHIEGSVLGNFLFRVPDLRIPVNTMELGVVVVLANIVGYNLEHGLCALAVEV